MGKVRNRRGQIGGRQAGFWPARAEIEILETVSDAGEKVAAEEGPAKPEGAEAACGGDPQLGGA